jgi:hypothetical protein
VVSKCLRMQVEHLRKTLLWSVPTVSVVSTLVETSNSSQATKFFSRPQDLESSKPPRLVESNCFSISTKKTSWPWRSTLTETS